MTVSPQYVADHFDELSSAVQNGEVVEIAVPEKASLRLVAAPQASAPRVLGAGRAIAHLPSEEELDRIDLEWKREIDKRVIGCPAE